MLVWVSDMKTSSKKHLLMALMCKWFRFFVGSWFSWALTVMGVFINGKKEPKPTDPEALAIQLHCGSGKAHKPVYQQTVTSSSWITVWWHEPQHPMASERGDFSCRKEHWESWAVGPSGLSGSWVNQPGCSAPCCRGKTDFASKLANLKVSWAPLHHPFLPYVTA